MRGVPVLVIVSLSLGDRRAWRDREGVVLRVRRSTAGR